MFESSSWIRSPYVSLVFSIGGRWSLQRRRLLTSISLPRGARMTFKVDSSKMNATKAFINTWLKDPTVYCASCGSTFRGELCCEEPYLTDRMTRVTGLMEANQEAQAEQLNQFASTKNKNMRRSLSMPTELLKDLESYFMSQYEEPFLADQKETRAFMKAFPQFCIARSI